jgi:RecA/RadA recombinase
MIEFVGNHFPIGRVITPFHSLNQALRDTNTKAIGFPTRTLVEIYGNTGLGKSTFVTSLASYISQSLNNLPIAYLDLEGQDENMITNALQNSGYSSPFQWVEITKGNPTDEKLLGALLDYMLQEPPYIGVLDSVAEISPVSEVEGDIGDANMGRRAFPMAQFSRQVTRALRMMEIPSVMFMINHRYEKMASIGGAKVYTAPGGVVKENLAKLRIEMQVPYVDYLSSGESKTEARFDNGWVLQGKVNKNRSGAKNEVFQVFIYGGWGIHVGMSALVDCLASGLATIKSGKVDLDGQDFGHLKKIVETKRDDKEFFLPFINALRVPVDTESLDETGEIPFETWEKAQETQQKELPKRKAKK